MSSDCAIRSRHASGRETRDGASRPRALPGAPRHTRHRIRPAHRGHGSAPSTTSAWKEHGPPRSTGRPSPSTSALNQGFLPCSDRRKEQRDEAHHHGPFYFWPMRVPFDKLKVEGGKLKVSEKVG